MKIQWKESGYLESLSYTCGYCGESLASEVGYQGNIYVGQKLRRAASIYICHFCSKPTFFDVTNEQTPGAMFGDDVSDVGDEEVKAIYEEARRCHGARSYTAAVLCCRKLLMHIAVDKGAEKDLSFFDYVQYLADKHFVPPDAKGWVNHIREKGNEANHEVQIVKRDEAETMISFCGTLLKVIYEFPARVPVISTS